MTLNSKPLHFVLCRVVHSDFVFSRRFCNFQCTTPIREFLHLCLTLIVNHYSYIILNSFYLRSYLVKFFFSTVTGNLVTGFLRVEPIHLSRNTKQTDHLKRGTRRYDQLVIGCKT